MFSWRGWGRKEPRLLGEAVCPPRLSPSPPPRAVTDVTSPQQQSAAARPAVFVVLQEEVHSGFSPNAPSAGSSFSSLQRWFGARRWLLVRL